MCIHNKATSATTCLCAVAVLTTDPSHALPLYGVEPTRGQHPPMSHHDQPPQQSYLQPAPIAQVRACHVLAGQHGMSKSCHCATHSMHNVHVNGGRQVLGHLDQARQELSSAYHLCQALGLYMLDPRDVQHVVAACQQLHSAVQAVASTAQQTTAAGHTPF